ncbi:MAG: heme lyase CcmF/NrfE family subunit [Hyphomonadaceae bacterium]|nr:heme lyase CcmF/NrfE family subunit [Hyphomonadaceae bacterium]
MLAEIGQISLIVALLIAVLQSVMPMLGAQKNDPRLMAIGDRAATAQFLCVATAFACLTAVFVGSDFSVKLAAQHSHSQKPLLYKFSGVWGNHEGSMLLWVLILSVYGALVPMFGKNLPTTLKARALSVQGMISVGFLAFILFTSNPFLRLNPVPLDGQGLNPILQDPGLAFHPPLLYLGYVGFSMAFSFSVAALIEGRVDAVWARWLRPWVLLAWSFLTAGITLGSVWAYYELGWGGWWMWDPVENVSFLPWLVGTALLHSILVLGKRHSMANWTVLLGITAFSLSLIGTFVVRSGVLTSVHSFAVDPARGVFILILLALATGGALTLYAVRSHTLRTGPSFGLVSKEGGLVLNNILLIVATTTVFLGTFYPLLVEAFSDSKISVGAPYFDQTFAPIMLLLIGFMGIGPLLSWRTDSIIAHKKHFVFACVLMVIITSLTFFFGKSILGALSIALAAYLAFGTLVAFGRKLKFGQVSLAQSMKLLRHQSGSAFGFFFAHMGMAIAMVGITAMSVWGAENAGVLKIGESLKVASYEYKLETIDAGRRDNFEYLQAGVAVSKDGELLSTLTTERRFYPIRNMVTSEAGIRVRQSANLYVGIGEGNQNDGWIIRAYYHPYVCWIWIGALFMAFAGFISLADSRLRFTVREPAPATAIPSAAE